MELVLEEILPEAVDEELESLEAAIQSVQLPEDCLEAEEAGHEPSMLIEQTTPTTYDSWLHYWESAPDVDTPENYVYETSNSSPEEVTVEYEMLQFDEAREEVSKQKWLHTLGASDGTVVGDAVWFSEAQTQHVDSIKEEHRKLWRIMNFHWTAVFYDLS